MKRLDDLKRQNRDRKIEREKGMEWMGWLNGCLDWWLVGW